MSRKKIISIDSGSSMPKYRQIIDSVYLAIEKKHLKTGDKLPSINQVCSEFSLSRDTVLYAFGELKAQGVIKSQPGKGYYVASTEIRYKERIFVLFDELNAFKEDLYNSLIATLKGKATVEVFFHHFNYKVFKNLINESAGNYTTYIIMPATFNNTSQLVSKLAPGKVYILDRKKEDLADYPVVFQDFEQDFYDALDESKDLIKKYRKLVFVNPEGKEPIERTRGFVRFCKDNNFKYEVARSLASLKPSLWEAYFLISDNDLVEMVKKAKYCKFKLGKKFGIVSFNDTMLKEVVAGGITTISTDFKQMGEILANMVLSRKKQKIRNQAKMIIRKSL